MPRETAAKKVPTNLVAVRTFSIRHITIKWLREVLEWRVEARAMPRGKESSHEVGCDQPCCRFHKNAFSVSAEIAAVPGLACAPMGSPKNKSCVSGLVESHSLSHADYRNDRGAGEK